MMEAIRKRKPVAPTMSNTSTMRNSDKAFWETLNSGISRIEECERIKKEEEERQQSDKFKKMMARAEENKKTIERLSQTIEEQNALIDKVFDHMERQSAVIKAMHGEVTAISTEDPAPVEPVAEVVESLPEVS